MLRQKGYVEKKELIIIDVCVRRCVRMNVYVM